MLRTMLVVAALAAVALGEHPSPGKVVDLTTANFGTVSAFVLLF